MAKVRAKRAPSQVRTVQCVTCQGSFETRHSQGRYCGERCAREGARECWRAYGERNRHARRAYHREHYAENADEIIARTKAYAQTGAGKAVRAAVYRNQRQRNGERVAARSAVNLALQSGRLVRQPCVKCGAEPAQAHHPDYSKPLDVVWLCHPCHLTEHGRVPRAPRPEATPTTAPGA